MKRSVYTLIQVKKIVLLRLEKKKMPFLTRRVLRKHRFGLSSLAIDQEFPPFPIGMAFKLLPIMPFLTRRVLSGMSRSRTRKFL